MYKIFSQYMANSLVKHSIISRTDLDIYQCGLELTCAYFANCLTTVALGFVLRMPWESLLFLLTFIPLRNNAGGYHAENHARCFILSTFTTASLFVIIKHIMIRFSPWIYVIILIFDCIAIFWMGTVETYNKPLDNTEVRAYSRRTRVLLISEIFILSILWIAGLQLPAFTIIATITLIAFSMIIGQFCNTINRTIDKSAHH